jgi:hypothetical protein
MKSVRDARLGTYLGRWKRAKNYKRDWISLHEDDILYLRFQASHISIATLDLTGISFESSISASNIFPLEKLSGPHQTSPYGSQPY